MKPTPSDRIGISRDKLELWFHRYGSEALAHVFRAAYLVWRSILADHQIARRRHDELVREFVNAA